MTRLTNLRLIQFDMTYFTNKQKLGPFENKKTFLYVVVVVVVSEPDQGWKITIDFEPKRKISPNRQSNFKVSSSEGLCLPIFLGESRNVNFNGFVSKIKSRLLRLMEFVFCRHLGKTKKIITNRIANGWFHAGIIPGMEPPGFWWCLRLFFLCLLC